MAGANAAGSRAIVHYRKPGNRDWPALKAASAWAAGLWKRAEAIDEMEREWGKALEAGDPKAFRQLVAGCSVAVFGGLAAFEVFAYIVGGLRFGWF